MPGGWACAQTALMMTAIAAVMPIKGYLMPVAALLRLIRFPSPPGGFLLGPYQR